MGIHVEQFFLFGSQAQGSPTEGSDIDLFIVSPDWSNYGERERCELLGIAAARILEPIQARGVTSNELTNHDLSPFWEMVLEEHAVAVD